MTKNRLHIILAAIMAATLAACSHRADEPQQPGGDDKSLSLNPCLPSAVKSRADLQDVVTDFAVVAWKEQGGSRQYVMRHDDGTPYQVRYFGGEWIYDILALDGKQQYLRFWDLSASSYTFSAYAPYSVFDTDKGTYVPSSDLHPISIDADGKVSITGITGNVRATGSTQWMTALHRRDRSPLLDSDLISSSVSFPTLSALTQSVPLVFHRIMSEIEFRAYNLNGTAFTISQITVDLVSGQYDSSPTTIYNQADYSGSGWTNLSGSASRLLDGVNLGVTAANKETATTLATLVEIPQSVAGRWIKVWVNFGSHSVTGFFQLPLWADAEESVPYRWEMDKKYIYTFALTESQEIILADIDVETFHWQDGNDVDIPDSETNW